jgi:hypothetical protein
MQFRRSNVADRTFVRMECFAVQSTTTPYRSRCQRDEEQREKYEEHYPSNLGGYYGDARKSEHCREDCDDKTNYCIVQHDLSHSVT